MGIWGPGIREDDAVGTIIDEFEDLLAAGESIASATAVLMPDMSDAERIHDDLILRLTLADVQWHYGQLDPTLAERVAADIDAGRYLESWQAADPALRTKRRAALRRFAKRIATTKKKPMTVGRRRHEATRPRFKPGDCLSIKATETHFVAAYVIFDQFPEEKPGSNMVGILDFISTTPPGLDVFRARRFRQRTDAELRETGYLDTCWLEAVDFDAEDRARIELIGNVPVADSDPQFSLSHGPWWDLGKNALHEHGLGGHACIL